MKGKYLKYVHKCASPLIKVNYVYVVSASENGPFTVWKYFVCKV